MLELQAFKEVGDILISGYFGKRAFKEGIKVK
jgi:hypothetical protein